MGVNSEETRSTHVPHAVSAEVETPKGERQANNWPVDILRDGLRDCIELDIAAVCEFSNMHVTSNNSMK